MKRPLLALLLLTASLAGCISDDAQPDDPASAANTSDLNPWQRGLDEAYST